MTLPFENDTTEIIRKIVSAQLKHDNIFDTVLFQKIEL